MTKRNRQTSRAAGLPKEPVAKELTRIRNLLALDLLVRGISSQDVDRAVQMGDSELRRLFPIREIRRRMKKDNGG